MGRDVVQVVRRAGDSVLSFLASSLSVANARLQHGGHRATRNSSSSFGDVGSVGGGWITGVLIKAGFSVHQARRLVMFAGAALCALSIVVVQSSLPVIWWGAICLVYLGHYALSANMFAAISDFFPNNTVARVTALTGIAGGFSGWLFPYSHRLAG
ncbi:MAG: hypothetical protein WKF84_21795 [Pyrinomonadaceae bacterium]